MYCCMVSFNTSKIRRTFFAAIFAAMFMVGRVAADNHNNEGSGDGGGDAAQQVGNAICANNGGKIIAFIVAAIAIFFVIKGFLQILWAWNDMSSPRQQDKQQGRERMMGGAKLIGAALFIPSIFGAFLQILGVQVLQCFTFETGLMGTVYIIPF